MRMRFFFILPDEYARVSCPLSSFTRKRASGSSSSTVPSNSIKSSLAKEISWRKEGGRPLRRPRRHPPGSDRAQIHSRDPPPLALLQLIAELLTLPQIVHPGAFHRRDVNEHVSAAGFRLDEAIPFLRIEPFDRTGRHQQ